jgi:alkylated DNA repair protein alkB family protein 1
LIPGYLSEIEQLALVRSSLSQYTCPPNPLSLSTHYVLPKSDETSLFSLYASDSETLVPSIASTLLDVDTPRPSPSPTPSSSSSAKRQLIQNQAASEEGYDSIVQRVEGWKGDEPSMKLKSKTVRKLVETELRWANLGWVYNVSRGFLLDPVCDI